MSSESESLATQLEQYDRDRLEEMYVQMVEIRRFEETAEQLNEAGEIPGPIHLYSGQEAVAVGTTEALRDDDIVGSTHRGHGHVLAKGADVDRMMAEIMGRETGLNSGRGGSMHMVDFSLGIFGCNAIVGASVPHVAGGVLSSQLDGDDRVGVAFLGDGAINEGVVMETLNIASVWDLPVVFLVENNQYAVSTPESEAVAGEQVSDRARGFDIEGTTVSGQNVLTVYETVTEAVERARSEQRPALVECETYRYSGHFAGEEDVLKGREYRTTEEIDEWRERRDPIETFRSALVTAGTFDDEHLDALEASAADTVDAAVEFARESDFPDPEKATADVYADQDYANFPAGGFR